MSVAKTRVLFRGYVLPHWPLAASLFALLIAMTALQLVLPRVLAEFIDGVETDAASGTLTRLAIAYTAVGLIGHLVGVVESYLAGRLAITTTNELRADLTLHCLRLDMGFHHQRTPGELIQRIDGDVVSLSNLFSRFLVALIGSMLLLVGILVMIFFVDWRLGGGLTLFSFGVLGLLYRLRFAGRRLWQEAMQANAEQFGFIEEHLAGTEDIRSSGATAFVMRRFWEHARAVFNRLSRAMLVGNATSHIAYASLGIGATAALAVAAWLFLGGKVTIGTVFLIHSYSWSLFGPIATMNRQVQDMHEAMAAVGRVADLLETTADVTDGPGDELSDGPLDVEVAGVDFGYGDERIVLHQISVSLPAGSVLGVLGRTGSGKTTLARLLARFYDPVAGSVLVGGVDLRRPKLSHLRSRIGVVAQDVQLFEGTLRDNLTFFSPSVDDGRLTEVLRSLGIDRDLDTAIASGGGGVSAGEAQLIAFARVFLRDPGLVILDEATSRLDPETERQIEHATRRLFAGRTAVVIAHRLRTVLYADEILILEGGRILEHGPRAELEADPTSHFAQLLRTGLQESLA